jgi:predicted membrane chloride channel (bestrophin family)
MKGTVMRHKGRRKPTNKDFQKVIQELQYRLMSIQSQVNALTEIFSDFLDYTHNKPKFIEYLKTKVKKEEPGSIENPEVKQEMQEAV